MKKIVLVSIVMLIFVLPIFARGYYQKVQAADSTVNILSLVTSNDADYTAPNFEVTAFILEHPIQVLKTGVSPTSAIRLNRVGSTFAAVFVQLDAFSPSWVAGETLRITVTKTDVFPTQQTSWDYTLPIGTTTISITNPVQYIPPMQQTVLSSLSTTLTAENTANIQWTTDFEADLLGFNVFRSTTNIVSSAIRVNIVIIPATNTSSQHTYLFEDHEIEMYIDYYYWLELVNVNGTSDISDYVVLSPGMMPIELSSFTATLSEQGYVNLVWTSQYENNLAGFTIIRSADSSLINGINVNEVLIPATNTSAVHNYSLLDSTVEQGSTYYYWIEVSELSGILTYFGSISVSIPVGIDDPIQPPNDVYTSVLGNAYPNPFRENTSTNIGIRVKAGEKATLTIYNILGQKVRSFSDKHGATNITWNGKDENGSKVGSGVYFYKLVTPTAEITKKMVIIK